MNNSIFNLHINDPYHHERPLFFSSDFEWKSGNQKAHIFIELNKFDVIENVHYQCENLDNWIPYFSMMAKDIEKNDIEQALEMVYEMPEDAPFFPLHIYCLHNAIEKYKGNINKENLYPDLICRCFGVNKTQITNILTQNLNYGVKEISEKTRAAGGCTTCLEDIEEIIYETKLSKADVLLKEHGTEEELLEKMTLFAKSFLKDNSLSHFYKIFIRERIGLDFVIEVEPQNKKENILSEFETYLKKRINLPLRLIFKV
ncbi:MAG: (2Fe-2S)-binding protein [Bacteriovoracaceae bacterium]